MLPFKKIRRKVSWYLLALAVAGFAFNFALKILRSPKYIIEPQSSLNSASNQKSKQEALLSYKREADRWEEPQEATSKNFDLFTPPTVAIENGTMVLTNYKNLAFDDTIPLYLEEISNKPYRLQLEGYYKSNELYTVILRDIEKNISAECTVGEKSDSLNVTVKGFHTVGKEKNGTQIEVPEAQIFDETSRTFLVLKNEEKLIDDEYIIIIKDLKNNKYIFQKSGDSVTIADTEIVCTLRSFNKAKGHAKILIKDEKGHEFRKTLHFMH